MTPIHIASVSLSLLLAVGGSAIPLSAAHGIPIQDASDTDAGRNLELGVHYVLVAKPDLAAANLQAAMDLVADDAELAQLVSDKGLDQRLEDAIRRGRLLPGAGDVLTALEARVNAGRLALARDVGRIQASVQALTGSGRQQVLARQRLLAAGEYAVPTLLAAALDRSNATLAAAAGQVLVAEGRMAVAPLCAVIGGNADPDTKKFVSQVLGEVAWPAAEPYLLQVAEDSSLPEDVRSAASAAYRQCGGGVGTVSEQFAALARQYFDGLPSVVPFPRDAVNVAWSYEPSAGLLEQPIATPVFGAVMAKRLCARALALDPALHQALVTYIAADLRESNRAPDGYDAGDRQYSPEFFARLSGVTAVSGVLGLALQSGDAPLALDAIAALADIGGQATIVEEQPTPLSAALTFGDRRVQLETALVLAASNPRSHFQNASLVVPTLAAMVDTSGSPIGAIIASGEAAAALGSDLGSGGFEPGAIAESFVQFATNGDAFGGTIDFVVIHGDRGFIERELLNVRSSASFTAVPVLLLPAVSDLPAIDFAAGDDLRCAVLAAGSDTADLHETLAALLERASGGAFTAEDAASARGRALAMLTTIGERNEGQFSIIDARRELITAARSTDEALAMEVAPVLALVPDPMAQNVLFDQAMARSGEARIVYLYALAEHARRMGASLDASRVKALLALVAGASGPEADAAGAAYGALDLPDAAAVAIIAH